MITPSNTAIDSFIQWGILNGIHFPDCCEFKYDPSHGISCIFNGKTANTEPIVIHSPDEIIITGEIAKNILGEALGCAVPLSQASTLLVWFLCFARFGEEKTKSYFQHYQSYVDLLPDVVDTPLIWNSSELGCLQNTNIAASRSEKLRQLHDDWSSGLKVIFGTTPAEDISYTDSIASCFEPDNYKNIGSRDFVAYVWAYTIVTSRSFPEYVVNPSVEDKSRCVLVPFIDLLNHNPHAKVEWSNSTIPGKGGFTISCGDSYNVGEEIYNNYGAKSNEELLFGYGFTLENNEADYFPLRLKLNRESFDLLYKNGVDLRVTSDYSTSAFDNSLDRKNENHNDYEGKLNTLIEEGALFFLKKGNPGKTIENLVKLFGVLTTDVDGELNLASTLMGISVLFQNVQNKLHSLPDIGDSSEDFSNSYRYDCAQEYIASSKKILKYTLKYLKALEKKRLSKHQDQYFSFEDLVSDPRVIDCVTQASEETPALELDMEILTVILFLTGKLTGLAEEDTFSDTEDEIVAHICKQLDDMHIPHTHAQVTQGLAIFDKISHTLLNGDTILLY